MIECHIGKMNITVYLKCKNVRCYRVLNLIHRTDEISKDSAPFTI